MQSLELNKFKSIMQSEAADRTSQKYSLIPTMRVIDVLSKHNWLPVLAGEMKCRDNARVGFQKHIVKFRNSAVTIRNIDQIQPEIILTNSHDGYASFCLQAGLYRFVCSNGLICADSVFSKHSIRHQGYTDQSVSLAIEEICDRVPTIGNKVTDFQAIDLTPDEKGIFAVAALTAKYGTEELKTRDFNILRLLQAPRTQDKGNSLWHTFNVVQEKLIKGARFEEKEYTHLPHLKHSVKARGVNSIPENIRINQALWTLTEKMAELKISQ